MAGTTHNDVLSVGMCPKMRPVGVTKKRKKGQKLSCVKLAICPDHPRRHRPLKFCVRGRVLEVVIYFKYHENRSRGLGVVGGGRKSPSPIDKAHHYRTSRDVLKPANKARFLVKFECQRNTRILYLCIK